MIIMSKRLKHFIYTLVLLAAGLTARAQNLGVTAKLDSTQILIGQQTQLHFYVHVPHSQQVRFPVFKDSLTSKVMISHLLKMDTLKDEQSLDLHTIRQTYMVTAFDEGTDTIPPIPFILGKDTFKTQPLILKVKTVKVDTTKPFYDIKQPIVVKYNIFDWFRDNWQWVLAFITLALIGFIVYLYLKNKKKPETGEPVIKQPDLPVHTIALNKLGELRDRKLWQQNQPKEYHIELTDIVREYIEQRFHVKTHEKTTDEILSGLRNAGITPDNWARLQQTLSLADLVKFAKLTPAPAENEQSMDDAIGFVTDTRQVYEPPAHKEGGTENV